MNLPIFLKRWVRPQYLLLFASLLVSILLAEGLLRLHYAMTDVGTLEDLHPNLPEPGTEVELGDLLTLASSDRLVYKLKPNLDVLFRGSRVQTNARGFREATSLENLRKRPIRIVGIGDSVMFGQGVEEAERYMDVLEARLNHDFPAVPWETVTIAAPGYNLVMEVEALKKYGLPYEPDLLIYGFVYNDFCLPDFVSRRSSVWSLDSFIQIYLNRRREEGELAPRREATVDDHGLTSTELGFRDRKLFKKSYCKAENLRPAYRDLAGEESFYWALDELMRMGRDRGISTVFLNYGRSSKAGDISLPEGMISVDLHRVYRDYLQESGFETITSSDLVISEEDSHPSAKGHRMIGTALGDYLVELGLIEAILEAKVGRESRESTASRNDSTKPQSE